MEERPPGGTSGGADDGGKDCAGWLSSSPAVGGTFGPQQTDVMERNLRLEHKLACSHGLAVSASPRAVGAQLTASG